MFQYEYNKSTGEIIEIFNFLIFKTCSNIILPIGQFNRNREFRLYLRICGGGKLKKYIFYNLITTVPNDSVLRI